MGKCCLLGVTLLLLIGTDVFSQNIGVNTNTPTETLDVDGTLRVRTGAADQFLLVSDSLGKANWTHPDSIFKNQRKELCVTDFGAVGDGVQNDAGAFQRAIDSAAIRGGSICIPYGYYRIDTTLIVPSGVFLRGFGTGSNPLSTPYNGSVLAFYGDHHCLQFTGFNSGIRDAVIMERNPTGSAGGIRLRANGGFIEYAYIDNVLIWGFTNGNGIWMEAVNSGGIAYCSFREVAIRHADYSIKIEQDGSSFVNSNHFFGGAITGGPGTAGIMIDGGNNNIFHASIFENVATDSGHIVIKSGSATFNDIRMEGNAQVDSVPIIHFFQNTRDSRVSGLFAGGRILNRGDNFIDLRSSKGTGNRAPLDNMIINSSLFGLRNNDLPFWEEANITRIQYVSNPYLPEVQTIEVVVAPGVNAYLRQNVVFQPEYKYYQQINAGAFYRTSQSQSVYTYIQSNNGVSISSQALGKNEWEWLSLTGLIDSNFITDVRFYFNNTTGTDTLRVRFTSPTLSEGDQVPVIASKNITSIGGVFNGTVSEGFFMIDSVPTGGFLVLPSYGNVFQIAGTTTINRVNDQLADRFPAGTVITLLFDTPGLTVNSNAFLLLRSSFTSTAYGSLTILSLGDGRWRELNRNN